MLSIFELSNYDIYRIQSIDPQLNEDWRETLANILPKLNGESQQSLFQRLLKPRGIVYDRLTQKFFANKPVTLKQTLENSDCSNGKLLRTAKQMVTLMGAPTLNLPIINLADRIEAMLAHFDNIELNEPQDEVKIARKIRTAFLYDLALWIDKIQIVHDGGMRQLTEDMIRSYFKAVFIKQKLQGSDFRSWNGQDIDFLNSKHFPNYLKQEAKIRRFQVVETAKYWFLVAPTSQSNQNPFSFRRFLFEDTSADGKIYLTHVVVNRHTVYQPDYKQTVLVQLSRLHTFERNVSEEVKLFINSSKDLLNRYLFPLLKKPLPNNGRDGEVIVQERMDNYEKQLSILILNKLPQVLNFAFKEKDDTEFLYYHLDALMKQMMDGVEDFRLQPLATYSAAAQQMTVKLACMRLLLRKTQPIFSDFNVNDQEKETKLFEPMEILKKSLLEAEEEFEAVEEAKQELFNYQDIQQNGSFWKKMTNRKSPDYTIEQLQALRLNLHENLFMSIVRLAKDKRDVIIYPEFECDLVVDEDVRHYAFPDGDKGVTRLPKIITLPQDREKFEVGEVRKMINRDIFKESQD